MARRQHDAYLTPDWATKTLVEHTPELHGARLLDPSCGDGRMGVDTAACWWLIWLRDPATGWWCRGSVTVVGRDVGQGHLPLGAA